MTKTIEQLRAEVQLYEGMMDQCDDHNDPAGYQRNFILAQEARSELQALEARIESTQS
jgi:hypothetical protein